MFENEIITARNLTKLYGPLTAVDRINFSIQRGECYGFLGPNGAGKTTTMRMIHCFSPMTDGELSVYGMDVRREQRKIKEIMGVVPQEENLDPDLRVLKNLVVYARYFNIPKREAEERAIELLNFLQLKDKMNSLIKELSGGMKRRLLIARSLMNNPKILILDEPTTGLDPQARHLIWQRLRLLKKNGITMILTTHYMEEASQICNRVAIMDRGKILLEGEPRKLVADEIGTEVIEIRLEDENHEMILEQLRKFRFVHEIAGDTLYLFPNNGNELLHSILDIRHTYLLHRPATMEDLFLKLTGRELRE
ncbi:MAG: ATP-binding cassette domain-containing protein [Nitrospinae bacterium]|nr:ATP-binding cassette domain-containing protein [Nitrospinota bacterium]